MFDSQVLEVAIGLVLMFFVLALVSSAIVELISGLFKIRAKQLEDGIKALVEKPELIYQTSVFGALKAGSSAATAGKRARKPSYVPARAFADAVVEAISKIKSGVKDANELAGKLPDPLKTRLDAITAEVGSDITAIKARLEQWFDDTMERVAGAFKRWSLVLLLLIALGLAIATNSSTTRVASTLWNQPSVREAVADAAEGVASNDRATEPPKDLKEIGEAVDQLEGLNLPVGWKNWDSGSGWFGTAAGWLITALLVTLGAPFWYGLLTRLVPLRSSGKKPPEAPADPASATSLETATTSKPAPGDLARALNSSFGDYSTT